MVRRVPANKGNRRHFSGDSSSFSAVLAGNERRALLAVADHLSAELGYAEGGELPGSDSPLGGEGGVMAGILNAEDESLVAGVRSGLAKVAAALGNGGPDRDSRTAVGAALDGAEMVMRGELVIGNGGQLPTLLPSFVFLVVLPVVEQDRALELSRRTSELVERALGE